MNEHLDPELTALFDEAHEAHLDGEEFTAGVLSRLQLARRRRLLSRFAGIALALIAGAFAAPFVGERTFDAVDWLAQNVPATGLVLASPVAGALAALLTWRIARRGYH